MELERLRVLCLQPVATEAERAQRDGSRECFPGE
jgi:hypothetical protein